PGGNGTQGQKKVAPRDDKKPIEDGDKQAVGKEEGRQNVAPGPGQEKEFTNSIGMRFRRIAGGTFQMGSDKRQDTDARDNEQPRHDVRIDVPFLIAVHKTTQGEFEKMLGRNPSRYSAGGGGKDKVT